MTFERWATALRRDCSRRRRSAPPTAASGSSSWPTPDATASNDGESPETWSARRASLKAKGINGNGCGTPLAMAVQMWPTPQARDHRDGQIGAATAAANARPLNEFAVTLWATPVASEAEKMASGKRDCLTDQSKLWSTPRASDGEKGGPNMAFGAGGTPLPTQAVAMWATPTATDGKRGSIMPEKSRTRKRGKPKILNYGAAEFMSSLPSPPDSATSPAGERSSKVTRVLNPQFVEWLMGWPIGWTACAVSATEWSRWWRLMRGSLSRMHSGRMTDE